MFRLLVIEMSRHLDKKISKYSNDLVKHYDLKPEKQKS